METFEVAHLKIQNVNVIIIFLASAFGHQTEQQQSALYDALQVRATRAGLAGNVVLVWLDQLGRMRFIAPAEQHPYFRSVPYEELYMQINKTLTCN